MAQEVLYVVSENEKVEHIAGYVHPPHVNEERSEKSKGARGLGKHLRRKEPRIGDDGGDHAPLHDKLLQERVRETQFIYEDYDIDGDQKEVDHRATS